MAALQILRAEEYVNNYCCYTAQSHAKYLSPALNKSCQDKAHRNFRQKIPPNSFNVWRGKTNYLFFQVFLLRVTTMRCGAVLACFFIAVVGDFKKAYFVYNSFFSLHCAMNNLVAIINTIILIFPFMKY